MKKSLSRMLARMAKDGDVETVAEFIEELIEGEGVEEIPAVAEAAEAAIAEAVSEANNGSTGAIAPGAGEITIDEDTVSGIIERLDKLIELLSAAPAGDDEPEGLAEAEEIAEIIEEIVEEAAEAAEGEDLTGDEENPAAEEISEMVESILEQGVSTTLEEAGEDEDEEDPEELCNDALRVALKSAEPVLSRMSRKERRKAARDIAAGMQKVRSKGSRKGHDRAAVRTSKGCSAFNALGKKIMASRNANYHK